MVKKIYKEELTSSERYYGPLITNPVRLGYVKLYPWVSLPFSVFMYFVGGYEDYLGIIKGLFLICIAINIVGAVFSFFNSFINRFKSLAYLLIAFVVWTIVMWLDFIGLLMLVSDGSSISGKTVYSSSLTPFYIILIMLIFLFSCGLYTWYYLPKNQGKRWTFNQVKEIYKKKEWLTNFGIAFGAAVLAPILLTGYVQQAFGLIFSIFLTGTLTAVIVDAAYASIYVKKFPDSDQLL